MPFGPKTDFSERAAYDPSKETNVATSIARLRALRSTWNPGDVIDEESGLTADDLDAILAILPREP